MMPPANHWPCVSDLHRRVGVGDAGLEEGVQVKAADGDDPEQEEADRAEVIERIEPVAEGGIEQRLDAHEQPLQQRCRRLIIARARSRLVPARLAARRSPPRRTAGRRRWRSPPPRPISPMPAISAGAAQHLLGAGHLALHAVAARPDQADDVHQLPGAVDATAARWPAARSARRSPDAAAGGRPGPSAPASRRRCSRGSGPGCARCCR